MPFAGGLPHPGGQPDRLDPPLLLALPPPAGVGRLPRGRPDNQGIHERGTHTFGSYYELHVYPN